MKSIIYFLVLFYSTQGAKIFGFYPLPSKSHQNVFAPILINLAERGHEVTYVTSMPPNVNLSNLKIIQVENFGPKFQDRIDLNTLGVQSLPMAAHQLANSMLLSHKDLYGTPEVQSIIQSNDRYDAVLLETSFAQEAASAFAHKFGAVSIDICTHGENAWVNELAGLPNNPAYQIHFSSPNIEKMGFWKRLQNTIETMGVIGVFYYHLYQQQWVMDKYFRYPGWETRPPIGKLVSNRSLILINADQVLSSPYPLAPHVKLIGGVNILPVKPLPKELKKFMDEASEGVILFSIGSNLRTSDLVNSPEGKAFLSAFSKLKQKVLMKWETDVPPGLPDNLKTMPWLPQQDILAHNNCILFISHGGYLSTIETVYHGVPFLGVPYFSDQTKNVKSAVERGYALLLEKTNITEGSLSWALKELLDNPRYTVEAKRRSRMLRDRRHISLEEAVYWIEYVIKYPGSLTPASAHMSFIQMHLIDVQLFILIVLFIVGYMSYRTVSTCVKLFCKKSSQKKKKLKKT